jgi:hypothetical protein
MTRLPDPWITHQGGTVTYTATGFTHTAGRNYSGQTAEVPAAVAKITRPRGRPRKSGSVAK